ncbi:HD domain-containing protein [Inquilinus limosus]|uniref:HD/PDEase domain-containing protein n=1 Tax=Inquilinus limosus MP06 TaxID=1398085 RepID=A0A0A0DE56_9PROT|nr:HD domain-containing protein [Inquilinus limosus]KGM36183.1 hypothetical protein P409_00615 [Inquilinus limosus MP06]
MTIEKARAFAIGAHNGIGQVRKYTGEPYWWHCQNVAWWVRMADYWTDEMAAAAWLHDVVEDTKVTHQQLLDEFGREIASLVQQVSDVSRPGDGNRKARKQLDLEHLAEASPAAKTIKLADIIDNTESIVRHDPNFAKVYLAEKAALLEVLTEGDPGLWAIAKRQVTP